MIGVRGESPDQGWHSPVKAPEAYLCFLGFWKDWCGQELDRLRGVGDECRTHAHRVYHKPTASLYARVPKCANNAIRLMLFAQFRGANLTDQQLTDTWRDADRPNAHASTGVLTVAGKPWNQRQLRVRTSRPSLPVRNSFQGVESDTRAARPASRERRTNRFLSLGIKNLLSAPWARLHTIAGRTPTA